MDASLFHTRADETLEQLFAWLDVAYEAGALEDLDLSDGVLSIRTATGRTFIVNKHTAMQEIWLASPTSGGLHFRGGEGWHLPDGRMLGDVLREDLEREGVVL